MTLYRTIVADPPWEYKEGFPYLKSDGNDHNLGLSKRETRSLPYPSMSLEGIRSLDVASSSDKDSRLFLWVTNKHLPNAFGVMSAWGFSFRQIIVWHKVSGGAFVASVAPNCAEFLLVGVRGKPTRAGAMKANVVRIGPSKTHSKKPDYFYSEIERVSPGPYLEMFARKRRPGWDAFGNQVEGSITLASATRKDGAGE